MKHAAAKLWINKHPVPPLFMACIIAERISTRHWITDCGPGIGSCMYVCMYVCHAFGIQLRLSACAMATLFVPQICMCAYCIAGNFRGRKLSRMSKKWPFRRMLKPIVGVYGTPQISWRKLLRVALNSQNSWTFSPSKVFRYTVLCACVCMHACTATYVPVPGFIIRPEWGDVHFLVYYIYKL